VTADIEAAIIALDADDGHDHVVYGRTDRSRPRATCDTNGGFRSRTGGVRCSEATPLKDIGGTALQARLASAALRNTGQAPSIRE
jgi:hypothetical protein